MEVAGAVDQLRRDPDAVPEPSRAALDEVARAELPVDLCGVRRWPTKLKR